MLVGLPTNIRQSTNHPASGLFSQPAGMRGFRDLVNWMQRRLHGAPLTEQAEAIAATAVAGEKKECSAASLDATVLRAYGREAGLDTLPNDLTRMLYLASLRDCNSGVYLHPELSQRIGTEAAHSILGACHDEVFRRLLREEMSSYVVQLEEYLRYARTEKSIALKTWQCLQAYRATVPVKAPPVCAQLFSLNIEVALKILEGTNPPADGISHTDSF